jgi:hypothetical protein
MDERKADFIRRLKEISPLPVPDLPNTGSGNGNLPQYVVDLQQKVEILTSSLATFIDQATPSEIGRSIHLMEVLG